MKSRKLTLILVIVTIFGVAGFLLGRFTQKLRSTSADASYNVIVQVAALTQLKMGEASKAERRLESSLYNNIVQIAEVREYPRVIEKIFIPGKLSKQLDIAVRRYVSYRDNVATNYTLPQEITVGDGADPEQLREFNRNILRGNELITTLMMKSKVGCTNPPTFAE